MTCKDILEGCKKCIHYSVCSSFSPEWFVYNHKENCKDFKDKSEYTEVRQGEWLSNAVSDEYVCSECDGIAPVDCEKEDFYESNYCPNCGAKMDGKEGAEG